MAIGVVAGLIVTGAPSVLGAGTWTPSPPPTGGTVGPVLTIRDGQLLSHLFVLGLLGLSDAERVFPQASYNGVRSYEIVLNTSLSVLTQKILIGSSPLNFWAQPNQLPNGADYLPPLQSWRWVITTQTGVNDTANWTMDSTDTILSRAAVWASQTYYVTGYVNATANITAYPGNPTGRTPTGGGFVLNAGGYPNLLPNSTGYQAMADSLNPSLVRISLATGQSFTGWNTTSNQPVFTFKGIDSLLRFANSTGGATLLSLPAGTWGDGNTAPYGTPVNPKSTLSLHGLSGHFLSQGAMYAIIRQFANHTQALGVNVEYWAIGNEIPLNSTEQAIEYGHLIEAAVRAVHVTYPTALVGTDVRLSPTYLATIAQSAPDTGFLGFHHYSTVSLCMTPGGKYCAPSGGSNGTTLTSILGQTSYPYSSKVYTPAGASQAWSNVTGRTIPLVNVETNLNIYGGGPLNIANGTDPRVNNLAGAAWLGALLVDSSNQNVSSIAYFTLTSTANITKTVSAPYGGFGFGLTNLTRSGTVTQFAPYYVMKLWDDYMHPGAEGINVTNSAPGAIDVFAVQTGAGVSVAVVNRGAAPVSVHLSIGSQGTLRQVFIVDQNSYQEVYNGTLNLTTIVRSGISVLNAPPNGNFEIAGYGFAMGEFVSFGTPH
ncbi:MAG: hypothetical protein L3J96_00035 [Thermoplasmata archaeon]|nr:hypothetical protein [Thermoplasmata archaeon]